MIGCFLGTVNIGSFLNGNAVISISEQPETALVYQGKKNKFTCLATGTGNITYQWYCNGKPIDGETNSSLIVVASSSLNNGNAYYCKCFTDANSVYLKSNVVYLVVLELSQHIVTKNISAYQNGSVNIGAWLGSTIIIILSVNKKNVLRGTSFCKIGAMGKDYETV